jgi:hypothetical protein
MSTKEKGFVEIVAVLLLCAVVIFMLWFVPRYSREQTTKECKERFGQEWEGRFAIYEPNFCVNPQGDVKYP